MAVAPASEQDRLYRMRHSLAHVMAEVVLEYYPEAKVGVGPPIDTGFYYDFDLGREADGRPRTFTPDDLDRIEARMRRIIAAKHPMVYRELTAERYERFHICTVRYRHVPFSLDARRDRP